MMWIELKRLISILLNLLEIYLWVGLELLFTTFSQYLAEQTHIGTLKKSLRWRKNIESNPHSFF